MKTLIKSIITLSILSIVPFEFSLANMEYYQHTLNWHADADGDLIDVSIDNCLGVYNPNQLDGDSDLIGDVCDSDYVYPGNADVIRDLKALNVSPYGAWFTFSSHMFDQYGWNANVVWSTNLSDLQSVIGINNMISQGNYFDRNRVYEGPGVTLNRPIITEKMQPSTHYYITAIEIPWDGFNDVAKIGNIIEITTPQAPNIPLPSQHPRIMLNSSHLTELQARYAIEGANVLTPMGYWVDQINQGINQSPDDFENRQRCPAYALMYRISGQANYLTAANACLQSSITYWETNELTGNQLRWMNSILAITADLMWPDLTTTDKNTIAAALMPELDYVIDHFTNNRRIEDTDEWIGHSKDAFLTSTLLCNAAGIDMVYSDSACIGLEFSKRILFGFHDLRMKRNSGFMAGSGGFEPDGYFYGQSTGRYLLEFYWALHNLGYNIDSYAPFFARKLNSGYLYATLPSQNGLASSGDTESFVGGDNDVDTTPFGDGAQLSLITGLLKVTNNMSQAGYATHYYRNVFQPNVYVPNFGLLYTLLFDNNSIPAIDYKTQIGTAYLAKGFGLMHDRSDWSTDASYFNFRAGWMGVDHIHADSGHFQLWRKGRWITHEALAYGGQASESQGHNVLSLDMKNGMGIGQFVMDQSQNATLIKSSINAQFSYASADLTHVYGNLESELIPEQARSYDAVQRSIVWIKPSINKDVDTIISFDQVIDGASITPAEKYWHIQLDELPIINDKTANVLLGDQSVDIYSLTSHLVANNNVTLSTYHPGGAAGVYGDPSYNHILQMTVPASRDLHMLNVIRSYDTGATQVTPVAIVSENTIGVQINNDVIVFPHQLIDDNQQISTLNFEFQYLPSMRFVITGLEKETRYLLNIEGEISDVIFTNGFESMTNQATRGSMSTMTITKDNSGELSDYAGVLLKQL